MVKWPGGRIAITSDGNAHDEDDIGGTPMPLALLFSAGLQDKIVHVDYANHFGHESRKGEVNKSAMMEEMVVSTEGAAARFGRLDPAIVFNCQTQLDAATRNFVRQALRSSATDPLRFICTGPMTTANRYLDAVKAAEPAKLAFIRCISHSANNGKHDPTQSWERMKREFPTVTYRVIANQNSAGGERGLCSPLKYWEWLKNSPNPDLQWLYSRNRTARVNEGKFDVSDAGMVYYVISGVGDERAGVAEFRALLEHPRASAEPAKSNVIVFYADDHGYADLVEAGFDKAFFKHSDAPGSWNMDVTGKDLPPQVQKGGYYPLEMIGDFWRATEYWTLEPSDKLVSSGWCLANPGREYVVFQNTAQPFTLETSGAKAPLKAEWFNPHTRNRTAASSLINGTASLTPPVDWGNAPLVMHLRAR